MLSGFYNDESLHGDYDTLFTGEMFLNLFNSKSLVW